MAFGKALGWVDLRDGHAPVESGVPCPLGLERGQGGPAIWLEITEGKPGRMPEAWLYPPPRCPW